MCVCKTQRSDYEISNESLVSSAKTASHCVTQVKNKPQKC